MQRILRKSLLRRGLVTLEKCVNPSFPKVKSLSPFRRTGLQRHGLSGRLFSELIERNISVFLEQGVSVPRMSNTSRGTKSALFAPRPPEYHSPAFEGFDYIL